MNMFKIFVLVLAIASTTCEQMKLFDLNKMYEQGTLLKFLGETAQEGSPVTLANCDDADHPAVYVITRQLVTPPEIIKGSSINIKVLGKMLSAKSVDKLDLVTLYNGSSIYTDQKVLTKDVGEGEQFMWTYDASVPTFCPSGNWEIFMRLMDKEGTQLSCLKAMFTMP